MRHSSVSPYEKTIYSGVHLNSLIKGTVLLIIWFLKFFENIGESLNIKLFDSINNFSLKLFES